MAYVFRRPPLRKRTKRYTSIAPITLPASAGSYTLTGVAAAFKISEPVAAGSFTLTGTTIGEVVGEPAAPGAFLLIGLFAQVQIVFSASAGAIALSGFEAGLSRDFEAWFPRPLDADSWTGVFVLVKA